MKTKEEILERHCAGDHAAQSTYLDLDGAIDGRTAHVLSAMEEYAAPFKLLAEWCVKHSFITSFLSADIPKEAKMDILNSFGISADIIP